MKIAGIERLKKPQNLIALSLAFCLSVGSSVAEPERLMGDVSVSVHPVALQETLPIAGASRTVTMSFRGVPLADVLRALAKKGGFNVVVDESVQGSISTDLNNVSIQSALETLKASGHLAYAVQGGTLAVATADSERGRSFQKSSTQIFHLKHANARVVADFLNQTVFADRTASAGGGASSTGGSAGAGNTGNASGLTVTPDAPSNSLIVVGTPANVRTVAEHLEMLDQPRQRRTWRLSHANALDVATLLSASVFNEGQPVLIAGGGSSSGASGGGSSASGAQTGMPTSLRVTAENIAEGSGSGQSDQSGQGGGSGGNDSALIGNLTLRARVKQTQNVQVSPNGPILIPDTRLNTLTLLGTAEQIAAVEAFLPTLDRKMPQVVLEASLVEVSETGRRELGFSMGANGGFFSGGVNNLSAAGSAALVNKAFSSAVGRPTSSSTPLESIFRFSSNPAATARDFMYQLNALVSKNKAKLLANPTVVTTSDNETMISLVDEIIRSVTITVGTNSGVGSTTTATDNIGEAGIVLNILPRVGADGTVSLRVRPVVSTVASTQTDRFGNLVTLLSKREVLAQNSVLHDGETFVLGGLLQDTNTQAVTRTPGLSSLPIVGALARNSATQKRRSELVILITPHIIQDGVTPVAHQPHSRPQASSSDGMVPVSLQGTSVHPSALPPLEKAHIISDRSAARKSAPLDSLRDSSISSTRAEPSASPASPIPLPADDVSDETIRGIMDRFK